MTTVLVTGGFGRVGKHVVAQLVESGYKVRVFELTDRREALGLHESVETITGDLMVYKDVLRAVRGVDIVCHLAAVFPPFFFEEFRLFDVNVKGTFHVLQAMKECGNAKKLVFASTDAVYATGCSLDEYTSPLDETMPVWPINTYGIFKYMNEVMIEKYARLHGFSFVNLRFFWLMDASEMIDLLFRARNYMDNIVPEDREGLHPDDIVAPLLENGDVFFEHITETRDICQGIVLAIKNTGVGSETINLAAPDRLDYTKYYEIVASRLGKPCRRVRVKGLKNYEADIRKAKKLLGYSPEFSVRKMMDEALASCRRGM